MAHTRGMSLILPGGSFVCREERRQRCLHPVPLVVRLLRRWLVPCKRFLAAYSRQAVLQEIVLNRGLKWWSWRTLRLWMTKGKWRVHALLPGPCCRAFRALHTTPAGVQHGRRRGAKVKTLVPLRPRSEKPRFTLRSSTCGACVAARAGPSPAHSSATWPVCGGPRGRGL